jgi:hypothetical protein
MRDDAIINRLMLDLGIAPGGMFPSIATSSA